MNSGENTGSLGTVANLKRLRGDSAAFGEADCCLSWNTVLERLRSGWTLAFLSQVRLAIDQGINTHHKPPGGACDVHISVMETLIIEILFNYNLQLVK